MLTFLVLGHSCTILLLFFFHESAYTEFQRLIWPLWLLPHLHTTDLACSSWADFQESSARTPRCDTLCSDRRLCPGFLSTVFSRHFSHQRRLAPQMLCPRWRIDLLWCQGQSDSCPHLPAHGRSMAQGLTSQEWYLLLAGSSASLHLPGLPNWWRRSRSRDRNE